MEKWGFPMGGLRSMAETLAAFEVPSSVPGPQAVPSRRRGSLRSSPGKRRLERSLVLF